MKVSRGKRALVGSTLIELIVSLIILVILAATVSVIILTSMNLTTRALEKEQRLLIADTELDFIVERLWTADNISLIVVANNNSWDINSVISAKSEALYIGTAGASSNAPPHNHGYIWYKRANDRAGRNVFGDSFYRDLTSRLQITVLHNTLGSSQLQFDGPTITLSVELLRADGVVVETFSCSIELLDTSPISQKNAGSIGSLVASGTTLPPSGYAMVIEITHNQTPASPGA